MSDEGILDPKDAGSWTKEDYERYGKKMQNVISIRARPTRHQDQRNEYCERCGGAKNAAIIWGAHTRRCDCDRRRDEAVMELRRVDPRATMTFDSLLEPDASVRDAAQKLAAIASGERRKGLFMFGLPGRGKTHLSVATARQAFQAGRMVGVYNLASLVGRIQSTYGYDDSKETRSKIISDVGKNDLVILDDIGKEHRSSNVESIVYEIVDGLYNARISLVASSNLPGKDFVARYDGAVLSRLGGMCEKVVIRGVDRREAQWEW